MIEEHLDEEYQNSDIGEEFSEIETQILKLEKKKCSTNYAQDKQEKLEKAIALLRLHVQSYQRIIIFNRRRARQRLRRRQSTLRNFFLQSLMEMQIRFAEMLPLAIDPLVYQQTYNFDNLESMEKVSTQCKTSVKKDDTKKEMQVLNFYKDVVSQFTNDQWLDTFHMPSHIFNLICSRLKKSFDTKDMDLETWAAMCIYIFATGTKFCSVAMLFDVEKKFVRQSLIKFAQCLLNEFPEKLSMPNTQNEFEKISNGFLKASNNMPCVAGVLTLFEIPSRCGCGKSRLCGYDLLKVQACIDNRLLFRKVEPTTNKPTMFLRSPNEISVNSKKFSDNCVVPYFIVAPDNYPLRNWLMQKYDEPREPWEYDFNKSCGGLNIFRQICLKRLFGRWHILDTNECIMPDSKSFIVKACCLLHNLLEESGEYFSLEWCTNYKPYNYDCKITTAVTKFFNDSKSAIEKRDVIAKMISTSIRSDP